MDAVSVAQATKEAIISTRNARGAAVLMSQGALLDGAYLTQRGNVVQFDLRVPEGEVEEARHTLSLCGSSMEIMVHLGGYERCYREVRDRIAKVQAEGETEGAQAP